MNPQKWQKVKEIFNQAVEMPLLERPAFLSDSCEDEEMRLELEKMLAFFEEDDDTLEENAFNYLTDEKSVPLPEKIGVYKIIREIGRGGMGVVYEAVRQTENFRQRVALKIIKRGMDSDAILSRFRYEQQILSSLEHPFIARFLDGGMTDGGLPFYAMEYVEGEFIDDYCREKDLSFNERLKLFRQVCSAIQYAHQNLVIHRDLKPSNILVTNDGTPKLLDFGIGKILASETADNVGTATALGMMTPTYASPEQIRGERVNTATDIYSLSVILYEILTGQRPYKFTSSSQYEIQKIVCESEPMRPSSVTGERKRKGLSENQKSKIKNRKLLKGDLDNIILKALRKEQAQRYASVGQFSEDIRRHLEGLPIVARPDTFAYRTAKFIKRNRISVTAAVFVFLSLCVGISVAIRQTYLAEQQKILAEKRFTEVRQIANKVVFKYTDAITNLPNSSAVREMILQDASTYLDNLAQDAKGDFALQRELAEAYEKLGDIQGRPNTTSVGNTSGAIEHYEKAVALFEAIAVESESSEKNKAKRGLVSLYQKLAQVTFRAGENAEKRSIYREKRVTFINDLLKEEPNDFQLHLALADIQRSIGNSILKGDFEKGYAYYEANVFPIFAVARRLAPEGEELENLENGVYSSLAWYTTVQGNNLLELEQREEAQKYFEKSLTYYEQLAKFEEHDFNKTPEDLSSKRGLITSTVNVGIALRDVGRIDESLNYLNRGEKMYRELAAYDKNNLQAIFDLGDFYTATAFCHLKKKNYIRAIADFEKSLELMEKVISTDANHHEAIDYKTDVLVNLANAHAESGNLSVSLDYYRQAEIFAGQNMIERPINRIQFGRIFLHRGRMYINIAERKDLTHKSRDFWRKARSELQKAAEIVEKVESDEKLVQLQIIKNNLMKCEKIIGSAV